MEDPVAELVRRARALSPEDRERLLDQLLEIEQMEAPSLDPGWEAEISRRLEEHDKGLSPAIDAAEVFAEARRLAR